VRWQSVLELCMSASFICRFVSLFSASLFLGGSGVGKKYSAGRKCNELAFG